MLGLFSQLSWPWDLWWDLSGGGITGDSTQAPDGAMLITGTLSNAWQMVEFADEDFDFNNGSCAISACAHPQINIHSATQNTTEYNSQAYWGNAGRAIKTLTDGAATTLFHFTVPPNTGSGGNVSDSVFAFGRDGTPTPNRSASLQRGD